MCAIFFLMRYREINTPAKKQCKLFLIIAAIILNQYPASRKVTSVNIDRRMAGRVSLSGVHVRRRRPRRTASDAETDRARVATPQDRAISIPTEVRVKIISIVHRSQFAVNSSQGKHTTCTNITM